MLKKRMTIMIIVLSVIFGGLIVFNLVRSFLVSRFVATYQPPAVSVSSVVAKEQDWHPQISAVGNFVALSGVDINSQASGNVVGIHFTSGQYIQSGKPLIDIDDSIDQATLKFNQSDLSLQEINFKRQIDLLKRGATSSSSVDEARAKLLQAQANVEKTQAAIDQKHIVAPFSGKLGIRLINLGQYISTGQTPIVTLQSLDPLFLEFYLPEQLLQRLHIGQNITFSVEHNPGLLFAGKITALNAKVDPNTHNIQVQATVPNCPAMAMSDPTHSSLVKLKKVPASGKSLVICDTATNTKNKTEEFNFIPGMFAAIEVEQPVQAKVVVLPSTAISYSLYGDSVFIIEKDPEAKRTENDQEVLRVRRIFITVGDQQGNYTVIKKGVKAGQTVVSSGELKLENDTRVVINNTVKLHDTADMNKLGE